MVTPEVSKGIAPPPEDAAATDILIAIAAPVHEDALHQAAENVVAGLASALEGTRAAAFQAVIASPATGAAAAAPVESPAAAWIAGDGGRARFVHYALPPGDPLPVPWLAAPAVYGALSGLARQLNAGACAILASDLAALHAQELAAILAPVLRGGCDLAMPVYPVGKYEGLLNSGILSPLSRALNGRRVQFPLAPDFGVSAGLLEMFGGARTAQGAALFWPAAEAAFRGQRICQVPLNVRHQVSGDFELSTVLAVTVGSLFAEMETAASQWQRTRGSQPVELTAEPPGLPGDGAAADVQHMLEAFQLGYRNLLDVWSLVLPPAAMLELKHLMRLPAGQFRMPDDLWVRIVYDFALAYRLRTISRSHLLGALTPLYLGWAASHVRQIAGMSAWEAAHRVERLARAYEEGKPYLVSRWRWPDRFNP